MASVVAVVSDLHINSTIGLCPPAVTLDDGGTYRASKAQRWIWANWTAFWKRVGQTRKEDDTLYVVINGDTVDGDHHQTAQIITRNMHTQAAMAIKALGPLRKCKPDYTFVVRGTEAHVGASAQWEEFIAKDIAAVPPGESPPPYSWWALRIEIDGVLFDIAHHGRTGYRPWTRANASLMLAAELVLRYATRRERMPHLAIRSHRHTPADSGDNYPVRLVQTPSWQLSTAYAHRIAPGDVQPVGGLIITCSAGHYEVVKCYYQAAMSRIWKAPQHP